MNNVQTSAWIRTTKREIKEICTSWSTTGHSCCDECSWCEYHEDKFKLPEPIPITIDCVSNCTCGSK